MNTDIQKIINASKAGGLVLKKYFGQSLEINQKTIACDLQTQADLGSEKVILEILEKEFPNYNIFSEEIGEIQKNSEYTFYIDPLDGTNNFVLGIPNFTVSIGLFKNEEIVAGVVHSPILDHTYYAEKNSGAFLDNKPIKVNAVDQLEQTTVCHNCGYAIYTEKEPKMYEQLYKNHVKRYMGNWSTAYDLCLLASGRTEAIITNHSEIYDFAAGKLIAKEAGAKITDFQGQPEINDKNKIFLATNGTKIHQEILKIIS